MEQEWKEKMASQEGTGEVMTDADFEKALDALREQEETGEVGELLKMMNENRMISWEEAEQILGGTSYNEPIKSSLPEQTRPTEPDNDTDVDLSIQRLLQNDPKLTQINLNNMKRTPIPQVKRLIEAIRDNTHLEKLALANMGLYDSNIEPLISVVENNETLKSINLETNYLSGDFFARLFRAALKNQTLEEVKAVNQGVTFATTAEKEIIDAIFENRGIIKVSINLRLPEGRHKIENAMLRNGEIKRILRRQAAAKANEEAQKKAKEEEVKKEEPKTVPAKTSATKSVTKQTAKEGPKASAPKDGTTKATKTAAKDSSKAPVTKDDGPKPSSILTKTDKPTANEASLKPTAKTAAKALNKAVAAKDGAPAAAKQPLKEASKETTANAVSTVKKTPVKMAAKTAEKIASDSASQSTAPPSATAKGIKKTPAKANEATESAAKAKVSPKVASKKATAKKFDEPMAVYPLKKL